MAIWDDLFTVGGLTMPSLITNQTLGIQIKSSLTAAESVNAAGFWTEIDVSHTEKGFESVSLTAAADTTEQTIVDVADSGVFTQAIGTALSASGVLTIRVTIDGDLTTFTSPTLSTADASRFSIGHFFGFGGETSATDGAGYGSANDTGYGLDVDRNLLPTPVQSMLVGGIGMVFKTSLKVTIQGSVNISAVAEQNKAAACYTTFIPEGL